MFKELHRMMWKWVLRRGKYRHTYRERRKMSTHFPSFPTFGCSEKSYGFNSDTGSKKTLFIQSHMQEMNKWILYRTIVQLFSIIIKQMMKKRIQIKFLYIRIRSYDLHSFLQYIYTYMDTPNCTFYIDTYMHVCMFWICSVKYNMMPIHFVILLFSRKINVTPVTSIDRENISLTE